MSYNPGDLVGTPFPYSDLKTKKRRPVLVLTHGDRHGDFICAAVTSVPTPDFAVAIDRKIQFGQQRIRAVEAAGAK